VSTVTSRPSYMALATRDGEWWAIEVPAVDGAFSQARTLEQVPAMAREAIALMLEVPEDSFDLIVIPQGKDAEGTYALQVGDLPEPSER
jgi:predicted RNase H-like HicB family nuclease